jgi:hypothetical protein
MKNRLSIAAKFTSLFFILAFGIVSIVGSGGGGSGHGGDGVTPTGTINKDNIIEIIHGINPYASLGDGSDFLADLEITDHACVDGGDVTTAGTISDPPAVSDTMTVTYNNCQEFGVITNGTVTITITQISGNPGGGPPYSATIHIVYNDLSSEDVNLGLVSTSSADMAISISEDLAGNFSIMIQGDSLTQQWDNEVETLSDFLIESTYNQNTFDFSLDLNGDLDSTLIGFPVSFNTTTLFTGNDNGVTDNPTAGVLHITTSIDNSQALLTALADGVSLEISVDADGDGNYEYVDSISWADLDNL